MDETVPGHTIRICTTCSDEIDKLGDDANEIRAFDLELCYVLYGLT